MVLKGKLFEENLGHVVLNVYHSKFVKNHSWAYMPSIPSSLLGYALMCAPSPLSRQARHLDPIKPQD